MATSAEDYSRSVLGASDELKDIFCEPCEHGGQQLVAEGFCVDCSEYLCGQCFKYHKRNKAFRHHVLQDKDNMPLNGGTANTKDICLQKCAQHLKTVEYFCCTCDSLGCNACITLDHKQCDNVDFIPEIVRKNRNNEIFNDFQGKLDEICNHVTEIKGTVGSMLNTSDELKNAAKAVLKKQRAEINKFFDDLEANMEKKIDNADKSNRAVLTAASQKYDSIIKDLTSMKCDVDTKKNAGQNCEVFIAIKRAYTDLEKLESEFQAMGTNTEVQKYKLHPMTQIQDMIKNTTEICRMETEKVRLIMDVDSRSEKKQASQPAASYQNQNESKVKILTETLKTKTNTPRKNIGINSNKQHASDQALSPQRRDTTEKDGQKSSLPALKSLSLKTEIDISTSNDSKVPLIKGVTVVQEHYAVVADYNNSSVKVIDTRTKKVTSEMTMEGNVRSVTNVNDDKIAVAVYFTIQFLSVSRSGSLSKDYVIAVDMICFDIVYYDRKLIVAQFIQVSIIDMQGRVLKVLQTDSNGKALFAQCLSVAISPDNKTIYMSDLNKNTVTSMTLEGKVKQIYTDTALAGSWGITVDNEGYVYVCSYRTDTIHQLSADCTKLQVFQDKPGMCITFSNRDKLYMDNGKTVKIYEIK